MGLGANWGLTVSINVKALNTFTKGAKALEAGADRIANVGKSVNTMLDTLGSTLTKQVKSLDAAVKNLETTIANSKLKAQGAVSGGGGGGGGDFVFPKAGHARKGANKGNETDTFMRKLMGLPKGLWDDFAPTSKKTRNQFESFVGTMPAPKVRGSGVNRERYYDSNQMTVAIMKGTVTIPIVKSIQAMQEKVVAALDELSKRPATARYEEGDEERPRRKPDSHLDDAVSGNTERFARQNRGPAPPHGVPTALPTPGRFNYTRQVRGLMQPRLEGGREVPGLDVERLVSLFRSGVSKMLTGHTFADLPNKFGKRANRLEEVPLYELPSAIARAAKLKPEVAQKRLKGIVGSPNSPKQINEIIDQLQDQFYNQVEDDDRKVGDYRPGVLRSRLGETKHGRKLGDPEVAVNMGHLLEGFRNMTIKNMGGRSTPADMFKQVSESRKIQNFILKELRIHTRLLEHAFASTLSKPNPLTGDDKLKKPWRDEDISRARVMSVDSGDGDEAPKREQPKPRRPVWDFRSDMQTPDKFRGAFDRVLNWGSAAVVVYGGAQKLGEAIKQMASFEEEMTKVRRGMLPFAADFYKLSDGAEKIAATFGADMDEVAQTMATFARTGEGVTSVLRDTQTAVLATNATELTLTQSTEGLIAAQHEFLMGAGSGMRVLDSWTQIERTTAVGANVLADATRRAGAASRVAGVDFDQFNGIVGAVGEQTRKSGDTIGTAMKFIFQHMRDVKAVESLQQAGVYSQDAAGNFKTARQALGELAGRWSKLSDAERNNIALSVAGTEHLNDFIIMMETWDRSIDLSVVSMTSQGAAMRANAVTMESLNKHVAQLKQSFRGLFTDLGESGMLTTLKGMVDTVRNLLQLFKGANNASGGFLGSLVGNGALVAGGLGAASFFGGNILGPALFRPGAAAVQGEGKVSRTLRTRFNPDDMSAASEFAGAEAAGEMTAGQSSRFWTKGRKSGVAALVGAGALHYGYDRWGKQALPGQAPTGRDAAAGIAETGLETYGMMQMFRPSGGYLKGGGGAKALGAALLLAGASQAYGKYQEYKKSSTEGTQEESDSKLTQLQAFQEKIAQVRGDIRNVIRQTAGGESRADIDVDKIQSIKDAMQAIDPAFKSATGSTAEFLKELQTYPDRLDQISNGMRGKAADIVGALLQTRMNSPEIREASKKISDLQQEQSTKGPGESVTQRVAREAQIAEQREKINVGLLQPFRAQMVNAGKAGTGLGIAAADIAKLSELSGRPTEDVSRVALQGYFQGRKGYSVNLDEQLDKAGVRPDQVRYYQDDARGPIKDIYNEQTVDKAKVGNSFVLRATDSDVSTEAALVQAKNIHKLVNEYEKAVDKLSAKSGDLLKNVAAINQNLLGMAFSSPASVAGGRPELQANARQLEMFSSIANKGARDFTTPKLTDPKAIQNALIELTGTVNQQAKNPYGIAPAGRLSLMHGLEDTSNMFMGAMGASKDKIFQSKGDVLDTRWINSEGGDLAEKGSWKFFREAIGDDAAEQIRLLAQQAGKSRDSGDDKTATKLETKGTSILYGAYKAGTTAQVQKQADMLRDHMQQTVVGAQAGVNSLGLGYARAAATGRADSVSDFLSSEDANRLRKAINAQTEVAKKVVEIQQKRLEELAQAPGGKGSEDYQAADQLLQTLQSQFQSLNDASLNLTTRVENVVVGMDRLNLAITRMKNAASMGGAMGQTGLNADQFAVKYLEKQLGRLGDQLAATKDPQDQARIQQQIDELRGEQVRRQSNLEVTKDYRGALGEGLTTNVLASRLQSLVGLPVENAMGEWREQTAASFREMLQRVAADYAPAVKGKGGAGMLQMTEALKPMLNAIGGKVHDLMLDANVEFRKQYLLASPSQRMAADSIRQQIREGSSAEEVFSDPYTRGAAANNPLFGELMQQALESETQMKALDFQEQIANYNKDAVGWLQRIYDATVNPARAAAGLAPAQAGPAPFVVPGERDAGRLAVGSLAKAGTGNIDAQGRIKRDWTPAFLDAGEVVLNKDQSDDYLMRRNRFARGTLGSSAGYSHDRGTEEGELPYLYQYGLREQETRAATAAGRWLKGRFAKPKTIFGDADLADDTSASSGAAGRKGLPASVQQRLSQLPALSEGMKRLYRGETLGFSNIPEWLRDEDEFKAMESVRGRWFNDDPALAHWYVEDSGKRGVMTYVDVAKEVYEKYRVTNLPEQKHSLDPQNEWFLPKDLAEQRQPFYDAAVSAREDDSLSTVTGRRQGRARRIRLGGDRPITKAPPPAYDRTGSVYADMLDKWVEKAGGDETRGTHSLHRHLRRWAERGGPKADLYQKLLNKAVGTPLGEYDPHVLAGERNFYPNTFSGAADTNPRRTGMYDLGMEDYNGDTKPSFMLRTYDNNEPRVKGADWVRAKKVSQWLADHGQRFSDGNEGLSLPARSFAEPLVPGMGQGGTVPHSQTSSGLSTAADMLLGDQAARELRASGVGIRKTSGRPDRAYAEMLDQWIDKAGGNEARGQKNLLAHLDRVAKKGGPKSGLYQEVLDWQQNRAYGTLEPMRETALRRAFDADPAGFYPTTKAHPWRFPTDSRPVPYDLAPLNGPPEARPFYDPLRSDIGSVARQPFAQPALESQLGGREFYPNNWNGLEKTNPYRVVDATHGAGNREGVGQFRFIVPDEQKARELYARAEGHKLPAALEHYSADSGPSLASLAFGRMKSWLGSAAKGVGKFARSEAGFWKSGLSKFGEVDEGDYRSFRGDDISAARGWDSVEGSSLKGWGANPLRGPKGSPLPLPEMVGVEPWQVAEAWGTVSGRYPKIAGHLKGFDVFGADEALRQAGGEAVYRGGKRTIGVPAGEKLPAHRLFHEVTHLAQDLRGQLGDRTSMSDDRFNTLEAYARRRQGMAEDVSFARGLNRAARRATLDIPSGGDQPYSTTVEDMMAEMRGRGQSMAERAAAIEQALIPSDEIASMPGKRVTGRGNQMTIPEAVFKDVMRAREAGASMKTWMASRTNLVRRYGSDALWTAWEYAPSAHGDLRLPYHNAGRFKPRATATPAAEVEAPSSAPTSGPTQSKAERTLAWWEKLNEGDPVSYQTSRGNIKQGLFYKRSDRGVRVLAEGGNGFLTVDPTDLSPPIEVPPATRVTTPVAQAATNAQAAVDPFDALNSLLPTQSPSPATPTSPRPTPRLSRGAMGRLLGEGYREYRGKLDGGGRAVNLVDMGGRATPAASKALRQALEQLSAESEAQSMGLTQDAYHEVMRSAGVPKIEAVKGDKSAAVDYASHQTVRVEPGEDGNLSVRRAERIRLQRATDRPQGGLTSGIKTLLRHESQHAIDSVWSSGSLYDYAPKEVRSLRDQVVHMMLLEQMQDQSPEGMIRKRAVHEVYGGRIKGEPRGAISRRVMKELRSAMAESDQLSPLHRQLNSTFAEGYLGYKQGLAKGGEPDAVYGPIQKSLKRAKGLLEAHGVDASHEYNRLTSLFGPDSRMPQTTADYRAPGVSEVGSRPPADPPRRNPRRGGPAGRKGNLFGAASRLAGRGLMAAYRGAKGLPGLARSIPSKLQDFGTEFGWGFREGNGFGFAGRAGNLFGQINQGFIQRPFADDPAFADWQTAYEGRKANYRQINGPSLMERASGRLSGTADAAAGFGRGMAAIPGRAAGSAGQFMGEFGWGFREGNGFGMGGRVGNLFGSINDGFLKRPFADDPGFAEWKTNFEGRQANRAAVVRSEAIARSEAAMGGGGGPGGPGRGPGRFGQFMNSDVFAAPAVDTNMHGLGGFKGLGLMAALWLAHSEKAQGLFKDHGLGNAYSNYVLPTADAGFEGMMVGSMIRGESLTGFNAAGWLAGRGGMVGELGSAARVAKMGVGKVLLPFEIANQTVNAWQGVNKIALDRGWIDQKEYQKGWMGTENTATMKEAIWSPFRVGGGSLMRTGANGLNWAQGKGYNSDLQAEADHLEKGKRYLDGMGSNWGLGGFGEWADKNLRGMWVAPGVPLDLRMASVTHTTEQLHQAANEATAGEIGRFNQQFSKGLSVPLVMLAGKEFEDAVKSAATAGPGIGGAGDLPAEYAPILKELQARGPSYSAEAERQMTLITADRMEKMNEAYESAAKSVGGAGFEGWEDQVVEARKRVAAMREKAQYLGENADKDIRLSGDGHTDWSSFHALLSGLPSETRERLAGAGAINALTSMRDSFGMSDDVTARWRDAAQSLAKTKPEATVLDLVNAVTGGREQDPNRAMRYFTTYNGELGLAVADPQKLSAMLGDKGGQLDPAIQRLNQKADLMDPDKLRKLGTTEAGRLGAMATYEQAKQALSQAQISEYESALVAAQDSVAELQGQLTYKFGPDAKVSDLDAKLALWNDRFPGVQGIASDLQMRWTGISRLGEDLMAQYGTLPEGLRAFEAQTHEATPESITPWKLIGRNAPATPDGVQDAVNQLANYAGKVQADRATWESAQSSQADAAAAAQALARIGKPVLERKRMAAFDHDTGRAMKNGRFEDVVRMQGDEKWRFGDDARAQVKELPGLQRAYNERVRNSAMPLSILDNLMKNAAKTPNISTQTVIDRLSQGGKGFGLIAEVQQYASMNEEIRTGADPEDPAAVQRLAALKADRDRMVVDSGFTPEVFEKATKAMQMAQSLSDQRAADERARAAQEQAEADARRAMYEGRDMTPVWSAKRHTGGQTVSSNEYVLQNTEGLVLTGSRMEEAVSMLGQIAQNRQQSPMMDGMAQVASQFLGRTPEQSSMFHEHGGNIGVTLGGSDDFYQKLAEAVTAHIGGSTGYPTQGQRIRKPWEV